jgi:hypothetical protein
VVVNVATFPGLVAPDGTVQVYVYAPAGVGVAVTVACVPAQTGGLVTATVGVGLITTVVCPGKLGQVVVVSVIITL